MNVGVIPFGVFHERTFAEVSLMLLIGGNSDHVPVENPKTATPLRYLLRFPSISRKYQFCLRINANKSIPDPNTYATNGSTSNW